MHVAGRVAVPRHQPQLVIDLQRAFRVGNHAMLIRAFQVFDIVAAIDLGQAAIDGLSLQARIDDCLVGLGMAHHRGQDEQGVFPLALINALAVLVENAAIINIHEGVGTALKFVVDV